MKEIIKFLRDNNIKDLESWTDGICYGYIKIPQLNNLLINERVDTKEYCFGSERDIFTSEQIIHKLSKLINKEQ
jgi:hypothetical protein